MIDTFVDLLLLVLSRSFTWLSYLYNSVGSIHILYLFLAIITISAVFKFILSPYLSGSSDSASLKKNKTSKRGK